MTGHIGDTPRGGPVQGFYLPRGTARRPVIARAEGIYLWDTASALSLAVSPVSSSAAGRRWCAR